jgi:hypothetical protein
MSYADKRKSNAVEGGDDPIRSEVRLKESFRRNPQTVAVYNVGAGNRGVVAAIKADILPQRPIFIGHELTPFTHVSLREGAMTLTIDQSPELQAQFALEVRLSVDFHLEVSRFTVDANQGVQFARHPGPRDAVFGDQAEVFTAAIIVHSQNGELSTGPEGVGQKVERPALVWAQRHRHWRATAACPLAATPTTDGQALFPVDAVELLLVHHHTHTLQHDANAPIPKPSPLLSNLVHFQTDILVIGRMLPPHAGYL